MERPQSRQLVVPKVVPPKSHIVLAPLIHFFNLVLNLVPSLVFIVFDVFFIIKIRVRFPPYVWVTTHILISLAQFFVLKEFVTLFLDPYSRRRRIVNRCSAYRLLSVLHISFLICECTWNVLGSLCLGIWCREGKGFPWFVMAIQSYVIICWVSFVIVPGAFLTCVIVQIGRNKRMKRNHILTSPPTSEATHSLDDSSSTQLLIPDASSHSCSLKATDKPPSDADAAADDDGEEIEYNPGGCCLQCFPDDDVPDCCCCMCSCCQMEGIQSEAILGQMQRTNAGSVVMVDVGESQSECCCDDCCCGNVTHNSLSPSNLPPAPLSVLMSQPDGHVSDEMMHGGGGGGGGGGGESVARGSSVQALGHAQSNTQGIMFGGNDQVSYVLVPSVLYASSPSAVPSVSSTAVGAASVVMSPQQLMSQISSSSSPVHTHSGNNTTVTSTHSSSQSNHTSTTSGESDSHAPALSAPLPVAYRFINLPIANQPSNVSGEVIQMSTPMLLQIPRERMIDGHHLKIFSLAAASPPCDPVIKDE